MTDEERRGLLREAGEGDEEALCRLIHELTGLDFEAMVDFYRDQAETLAAAPELGRRRLLEGSALARFRQWQDQRRG